MTDQKKPSFFITRLKNLQLSSVIGSNEELLSHKLEKDKKELSYWDFISDAYQIDESVSDPDLMNCMLFEKALFSESGAVGIKILNHFKDSSEEKDVNTLETLLKKDKIDISEFSKEL